MLRFPNPGSDIDSFIRIFKTLHTFLSDRQPFGLDDMSKTLTASNLAASSGYVGEEALRLSTRSDRSRDPLFNQSKMYAELFRSLGWICSIKGQALSFVFTFLGDHVAVADVDSKIVFEESLIGAVFPNRILEVLCHEISRPYQALLFTAYALDGFITRDEMIIGPLSSNDNNPKSASQIISSIQAVRGNRRKLQTALNKVATSAGIQVNTLHNYTRFPMAALQYCGWFTKGNTPNLYPGGRNVVLTLTDYGRKRAEQLKQSIDWRLNDFDRLPANKKDACIKYGFYSMLNRAQYDVSPLEEDLNHSAELLGISTESTFVFSPYQTVHYTEADKALGIQRTDVRNTGSHSIMPVADNPSAILQGTVVHLTQHKTKESSTDSYSSDIGVQIHELLQSGLSQEDAAQHLFSDMRYATQETYYPFIASLFSLFGLDCHASRAGINYERWDAIIVDDEYSIPIEIKSPTEEEYLSIKAVRQALENKVVLLSRKAYQTDSYSSTMAIGYRPPNDRAEVARLIQDIFDTYGVRIAILDLLSLLKMSISVVAGTAEISLDTLRELEGIVDVKNS